MSPLAFLGAALSICATGTRAFHVASLQTGFPDLWRAESPEDMCVDFKGPREQTQTDYCFHYYKQNDTRLGSHGAVAIDRWYGRLGNNLLQVAHAIFTAKLSEHHRVIIPSVGHPLKLFQLPPSFDIEPDSEFRTRVNCSGNGDCQSGHWCFKLECTGVTRSDYTGVLRKYVLPHLVDEAREECKQEASNTKHELVIHLRSGDLLDSEHFQSRFAPCSFFDVLVEGNMKFERVRAITQPDLKHPCLKYFAENKNVIVQSKSLEADACALMHAKHLGFGALSTFSATLSMFNRNHVTLYDPLGNCSHGGAHECPFAKRVSYCIPGILEIRTGKKKIDWMLDYPKRSITKDGEECFE